MENLTIESFKEKVFNFQTEKEWKFNGNKPAIIDFYADWCQPCKMLSPVFEELSKEYDGKIDFYKINTQNEQELSAIFGIRSIPSILFIPMNEQPQMVNGFIPKQNFKEIINKIFNI